MQPSVAAPYVGSMEGQGSRTTTTGASASNQLGASRARSNYRTHRPAGGIPVPDPSHRVYADDRARNEQRQIEAKPGSAEPHQDHTKSGGADHELVESTHQKELSSLAPSNPLAPLTASSAHLTSKKKLKAVLHLNDDEKAGRLAPLGGRTKVANGKGTDQVIRVRVDVE